MVVIAKEIKNTVGTIYVQEKEEWFPAGTGFFISEPHPSKEKEFFVYFVTAKHVIAGEEKIRIKLSQDKEGGKEPFIDYNLNPTVTFCHEGNKAVDIILLPIILKERDNVKQVILERKMFATKKVREEQGMMEGDEILFIGMMPGLTGREKNPSIVRHGKLALLTNEESEIYEGDDYKGKANLIYGEIATFGGSSGSPVFLRRNGMNLKGGNWHIEPDRFWLLGIMGGYVPTLGKVKRKEEKTELLAELNSHIGFIIPTDYIEDILRSSKAEEFRTGKIPLKMDVVW